MKKNILNFSLPELEKSLTDLKIEKYRSKQIFEWIYKKNITDINLIKNFSQDLKNKLNENFEIKIPEIFQVSASKNFDSYKFLLKTYDNNLIESILMLADGRATICISCMIGCPLKCKFCATGTEIGFVRKLEQSEIIGQILAIRDYAIKNNITQTINNIVFMGMGEPMLNLKNVSKVVEILLQDEAFGISRAKITVSTAGVPEGMANFFNKYRVNLALSLHFTNDEQRSKYMPINIKYNIKELLKELRKIRLQAVRDFITIEYIMINNLNDSINDADQLARLLNGIKAKVNLIPFNPTKNMPDACPSSEENINNFARQLISNNLMVTVRRSLGKDIEGACGQFALKKSI